MALDLLRPFWWVPCLLVLGYSVAGEGNRVSATAAAGMITPRVRSSEEQKALMLENMKHDGKQAVPAKAAPPAAGGGAGNSTADAVIPLLLDWQGKRPVTAADTGLQRNLFIYEHDIVKDHEDRLRSEAQRRIDGWQGQGIALAQASLRQVVSFSCELRYGGDCPSPPPPPPVAPRFAYELVGVFSSKSVKQAAFIDPATRTIIMARQDEKIGDTPFRVRKFNLTSVEVGADGFTENEKIPMSKKGDDTSGSNSL